MATDNAMYLMRIASEISKLANRIERLDERVNELFEWKEGEDAKAERDSLYEIVDRNAPLDPWYGHENLPLGEKEVAALRDGKILYHEDGEYAKAIYFEGFGIEPNWNYSRKEED
jgi:hypothetical protein